MDANGILDIIEIMIGRKQLKKKYNNSWYTYVIYDNLCITYVLGVTVQRASVSLICCDKKKNVAR